MIPALAKHNNIVKNLNAETTTTTTTHHCRLLLWFDQSISLNLWRNESRTKLKHQGRSAAMQMANGVASSWFKVLCVTFCLVRLKKYEGVPVLEYRWYVRGNQRKKVPANVDLNLLVWHFADSGCRLPVSGKILTDFVGWRTGESTYSDRPQPRDFCRCGTADHDDGEDKN